MRASEALERVIQERPPPTNMIDIGAGAGDHARAFRKANIRTFTLDSNQDMMPNVRADFDSITDRRLTEIKKNYSIDGVWAAHVLEHMEDVGEAIHNMAYLAGEGNLLAITVPPMKPDLVGGHLSLWTPGLLVYNMVRAGLDCSEARVGTYGYNISVIVRVEYTYHCSYSKDKGEIEQLAHYFPWPVKQGHTHFPNVRW